MRAVRQRVQGVFLFICATISQPGWRDSRHPPKNCDGTPSAISRCDEDAADAADADEAAAACNGSQWESRGDATCAVIGHQGFYLAPI